MLFLSDEPQKHPSYCQRLQPFPPPNIAWHAFVTCWSILHHPCPSNDIPSSGSLWQHRQTHESDILSHNQWLVLGERRNKLVHSNLFSNVLSIVMSIFFLVTGTEWKHTELEICC